MELGRVLVFVGLAIALAGVLIWLGSRFFPWLGNLPGDIRIEGEKYSIYIPLATMLLISIVGSILLNIVLRIFRK